MQTKYELTFDMSALPYSTSCYLTVRVAERLDIDVEAERMEKVDDAWRWIVEAEADSMQEAINRVQKHLPDSVGLLSAKALKGEKDA